MSEAEEATANQGLTHNETELAERDLERNTSIKCLFCLCHPNKPTLGFNMIN